MAKKIQLIVPHHDEPLAVLLPLLQSVALQQSVDFGDVGVIVVHDGCEKFKSLPDLPYEVEEVCIPKSGVSAARNAGLDAATADYVAFCDCDDMFFNMCGLYIVLREIANGGFDTLVSAFVEETRDLKTKTPVYVTHALDMTFVHGKFHRRQFLLDNAIRWDPSLTVHEDSYFHRLVCSFAANAKQCPTAFYLWKWRDGSVCRRDPKYMLKTYREMIRSTAALVRELAHRGKLDKAAEAVAIQTYDAYFTMNKTEWLNFDNREYREDTERDFGRFRREFRLLADSVPEGLRNKVVMGIKSRMFAEGVVLEKVTFDDWIRKVDEEDA